MKAKGDKLTQQLAALKAGGDDAWESIKAGFEDAWEEWSKAFEEAASQLARVSTFGVPALDGYIDAIALVGQRCNI